MALKGMEPARMTTEGVLKTEGSLWPGIPGILTRFVEDTILGHREK